LSPLTWTLQTDDAPAGESTQRPSPEEERIVIEVVIWSDIV
jgi:hypothetical protein